jgi:hypothetical protein
MATFVYSPAYDTQRSLAGPGEIQLSSVTQPDSTAEQAAPSHVKRESAYFDEAVPSQTPVMRPVCALGNSEASNGLNREVQQYSEVSTQKEIKKCFCFDSIPPAGELPPLL